ncbi:MAG: TadE/TadG family type IV pilus assembly protein [Hyphomicrobium sp.]
MDFTRAFRRSERGNISIMMAQLLVPVVMLAGGAIDFARCMEARSRIQDALDAALLSGIRTLQTNGGARVAAIAVANKIYGVSTANMAQLTTNTVKFSVGADGLTLRATGEAKIKTPFLSLASIPELSVISLSQSDGAEAAIGSGKNATFDLEIALMLDVTGSMSGARLESLKTAAKDLIDLVVSDDQGRHTSRVAIVPYAAGVNAGKYTVEARGPIANGTCNQPGCKYFQFVNALRYTRILPVTNCVSERTGPSAYTDESPAQRKVGYAYLSNENTCPSSPVVPLSGVKEALFASIDQLRAGGSTGAQAGFAWAWYTLSPNWASLWPESAAGPYNDKSIRKFAILMTDGEFNSPYCKGVIAQDATSGSGSAADHINCNAHNGSSYAQAESLCTAMKASGVEVYTVGFDVIDSGAARAVMKNCASSPDRTYNAQDSEQLLAVFRDIGMKIVTVYLSR